MPDSVIAVTGADGFIGSHLVEEILRGTPLRVRALCWYNSFGHHGWLDQVRDNLSVDQIERLEIVVGDIRDASAMRQFIDGSGAVLHLAALIAIPYSYQAAESYVDTNIRGTLNLLEAARHTQISRFVHISSSEVYGTAQIIPMKESHPLVAQSPYAATKIAADQLALSYWRAHGLPVTILRPFNTYGPRQSVRAIVPTIIVQALQSECIELGNVQTSRDLLFVNDTVAGMLAALDPLKKINGETINLGTGRENTIAVLVEEVGRILRKKLSIVSDNNRMRPTPSDVTRLVADRTQAKALLGWEAKSSLADGLSRTIDWFRIPANRTRFHHDSYRL